MKKVLFATTALIATASVAAADVKFGGYGRFGVKYKEGSAAVAESAGYAAAADAVQAAKAAVAAATTVAALTTAEATLKTAEAALAAETAAAAKVKDKLYITSRFRLNITGETTTDSGVNLEARLRIQADDAGDGSAKKGGINGARFQVSTDNLQVQVGNISGVFDDGSVFNYYGHEPGLTAFVGQYSTLDAPIMGYTSTGAGSNGVNAKYSMNGFTVMASFTANDGHDTYGDQVEFGIGYDFNGWQIGIAAGQADSATGGSDVDYWAAGASGSVGVADLSVFVGDSDKQKDTSYGISASFDAGASTDVIVSLAGGGKADAAGGENAYGLGVVHDLGGGASLKGGIGQGTDGKTVADFGVLFKF